MPNGQKAAGFKPIFGTVQPGSDDGVERLEPIVNGASSAPLSRQSSRVSRRGSPVKSVTQLPSPSQPAVDTMRFGTGPFRSQPMMGNASAPLPQQPFNPNANNFPRPPRRDGRNSFSAVRGRGGFRGGRGFHDVAQENLYQRGYGMGYQQQPYGFPGMYDPAQAQFANMQMFGRGAMPPPPLPQTPAQNLDPLRFYVLGQVSSSHHRSVLMPGRILLQHAESSYGFLPSAAGALCSSASLTFRWIRKAGSRSR